MNKKLRHYTQRKTGEDDFILKSETKYIKKKKKEGTF